MNLSNYLALLILFIVILFREKIAGTRNCMPTSSVVAGNEPTNEPTNQQTRVTTIPLGGGKNQKVQQRVAGGTRKRP